MGQHPHAVGEPDAEEDPRDHWHPPQNGNHPPTAPRPPLPRARPVCPSPSRPCHSPAHHDGPSVPPSWDRLSRVQTRRSAPCAQDTRRRSLASMTTMSGTKTPIPVIAGAVLLVLLTLASSTGVLLFAFVWTDQILAPGLMFAAVALAAALTALAAVPRLLRGDHNAWLVAFSWASAFSYWSVYKVFGEAEYESTGFLVAGLLIIALLTTPATQRHVTERNDDDHHFHRCRARHRGPRPPHPPDSARPRRHARTRPAGRRDVPAPHWPRSLPGNSTSLPPTQLGGSSHTSSPPRPQRCSSSPHPRWRHWRGPAARC